MYRIFYSFLSFLEKLSVNGDGIYVIKRWIESNRMISRGQFSFYEEIVSEAPSAKGRTRLPYEYVEKHDPYRRVEENGTAG